MTRLTKYRKQHQLTLIQMADEIGINPSTLHRIEHNIGYNTTRRIIQWCTEKGINPVEIFPPSASA